MKVIKNKKYAYFAFASVILAGTLLYLFPPHLATTSATDYTGSDKAEGEWVWSVNVQEVLNLTITPPTEGAKGDTGKFLRNKYKVAVSSNNDNGYTAGMTTKTTDTALANTVKTTDKLTTLAINPKCGGTSDADCSAFPVNNWGYSLDDTESGKTGTYRALVGSNAKPITVMSAESVGSEEKEVFFGAKVDATKASGVYKGTVVFTVTSGTQGSELPAGPSADPVQPVGPSMEPSAEPAESGEVYAYTTGNRTYRSTATSIATTAAAENEKKRRTAADYVSPLGVNEKTYSTANIQRGSVVTTILMSIAFLAAGIGIFFFILAKRRDEEEEDDIQEV